MDRKIFETDTETNIFLITFFPARRTKQYLAYIYQYFAKKGEGIVSKKQILYVLPSREEKYFCCRSF